MNQAHDWYTNHEWRNAYIEETIRCLSKTGSLGEDDVLVELAGVLSKQDAVELYTILRQSRRAEIEWRQEFLAIFSGVQESDLPAIVYDQSAANCEETPEQFRPPRMPLNIQSDEDIPY
jgi:hypothetical protein